MDFFDDLDAWYENEFPQFKINVSEEIDEILGEVKYEEKQDRILTLDCDQALYNYDKLYGKQKHWLVNPFDINPGEKEDFLFVLHCYNKYKSKVDKNKNIPARWSKVFTSELAKAMKPFGDFADYTIDKFNTIESIYQDQIKKLLELRSDRIDGEGTLYNEALYVIKERIRYHKREDITEQKIMDYLSSIIANGSKGILGEIITCELLKEKYKDHKRFGFRRAPGYMEKDGIDAQIFLLDDPEKVKNISIKCFNAFNDNTFNHFLKKERKTKADYFAGIKDLDFPELLMRDVRDL